ncbi:MAG: hypothetical protein U1F87_05510 [Kiritimatiellia bacterium]
MNVRRGDAPSDPGYPSRRQLLKAGVMLGAAGLVGCTRTEGAIRPEPSSRNETPPPGKIAVEPRTPDPGAGVDLPGDIAVDPRGVEPGPGIDPAPDMPPPPPPPAQ